MKAPPTNCLYGKIINSCGNLGLLLGCFGSRCGKVECRRKPLSVIMLTMKNSQFLYLTCDDLSKAKKKAAWSGCKYGLWWPVFI